MLVQDHTSSLQQIKFLKPHSLETSMLTIYTKISEAWG